MNRTPIATRNISLLLCTALLAAACAGSNQTRTLDLTLTQYEKLVRWSEWDLALDFLAPDYLQNNPVTPLDLDRLRLFRVTQYNVRSSVPYDNGTGLRQAVEIRLFNRNRAVERVIMDRQDWRYEEASQRWLLHSGLPDVTRAR
jgi:hypothetical protein